MLIEIPAGGLSPPPFFSGIGIDTGVETVVFMTALPEFLSVVDSTMGRINKNINTIIGFCMFLLLIFHYKRFGQNIKFKYNRH